MQVLDLFSGIGGFSLGLERAGMRTIAFCEIDPYCRAVLAKHWPAVPIFGDVRELTAEVIADTLGGNLREQSGRRHGASGSGTPELRHDGSPRIDLICGGFPCQDISVAGKGAGIAGERSGLWKEFGRIIGEVRPRYCIVENVSALLGRGLSVVLGDLAALGYDAEWHCIPASAVGAPHRRDRLWIVAHSARNVCAEQTQGGAERQRVGAGGQSITVGHSIVSASGLCGDVADAEGVAIGTRLCADETRWLWGRRFGDSGSAAEWWFTEPNMGRVAHGVSARVDRLRALGNAVVPQIPEIIGRAIMAREST